MSVAILTEATSQTGLGHFTRCCAIAQILASYQIDTAMFVTTDTMPIPEPGDGIRIISEHWHEQEKLQATEITSSSAIIIDSYLATVEEYAFWANKTPKLYCLDDFNRIIYPETATIINPGLGGLYISYDNQKADIQTGRDYILLRSAFRESFPIPEIREYINSILITVGGDDRWNIVPALLSFFTTNYPDLIKHVLIGPGFSNKTDISLHTDINTKFHENLTALDIRDLMLSCDLAVTGGGQTTNELTRCGVPMIVLKIADNQSGNIHGLIDLKLIRNFCRTPHDAVAFVASEMIRLTSSLERSKARLPNPETIGSGSGYSRIFSHS